MQIPQTTYALIPGIAFPGMAADSSFLNDKATAFAGQPLDIGLGVVTGYLAGQPNPYGSGNYTGDSALGISTGATGGESGPNVCLPTTTTLTGFYGVTKYEPGIEPTPSISPNRFAIGQPVPVWTKGKVWVQIDATSGAVLTAGSPVYLVYDASGTNQGRFSASVGAAGTHNLAVLLPGAICRISGTAGGIGLIEFNALDAATGA